MSPAVMAIYFILIIIYIDSSFLIARRSVRGADVTEAFFIIVGFISSFALTIATLFFSHSSLPSFTASDMTFAINLMEFTASSLAGIIKSALAGLTLLSHTATIFTPVLLASATAVFSTRKS